MKKFATIVVTVVFLIALMGIQVNKHYSYGKLYSIAVFHNAENCCSTMEPCDTNGLHNQKRDCSCKNETELLKVSNVFINENNSLPKVKVLHLLNMGITAKKGDFKTAAVFHHLKSATISLFNKTVEQSLLEVFIC